ncbi:Hypothetical predicted protein [Paramuricea clavata]|uniref:Uncharacterized protein n=1 Tax=Paramuricea clavata TaxID=317549 RepID=A0A6S7FUT0_PARCT|nr:Hypothetical predicted protein [Paramuricea clavata]
MFILPIHDVLTERKYETWTGARDSVAPDDIIASHIVDSEVDCSLKCVEEQSCVGYNYREKSYNDAPIVKSAIKYETKKAWILVARFSNADSEQWISDDSFWYDRVTPYGEENNLSSNTDMISAAFWELKGNEMKITRSDDSTHTALLQTTSNCLQGRTFRSKITSFGNFRNGSVWANNRCLGSCPVIYGGQYESIAGFEHHSCNSDIQNSGYIGFWCNWGRGDGAVMMIGGGGNDCGRADHGIGITEEDEAKFSSANGYDFGTDGYVNHNSSTYSLNLWVC